MVERVTSTFSYFHLDTAHRDLLDSDPHNVELQHLQVPEKAGGEVDLLLGTLYNSCHPVPLYQLSYGLSIY